MLARREQNSPEDKNKFITYILDKMKLPTEHIQTKDKVKEKRFKKNTHGFGTRGHHSSHA